MKTIQYALAEQELCISDVTVISGVRPKGRCVDHRNKGRSTYGILYIWSGEACFLANGERKITAEDGDLLLIPKGYKYQMQYTAEVTTFVLVNLDLFAKDSSGMPIAQDISLLAKDDDSRQLARIMTNFELCSGSNSLAAVFRRKELVYRLLGKVFKNDLHLTDISEKNASIFAGVLLLQQTYLENLPVAKFAEASNMSINSFRTMFTKQYGLSPIQYRNRLRINRAMELLNEGSCTVAEAAYASGFENVGYFCRYYKKVTGQTPSEAKLKDA